MALDQKRYLIWNATKKEPRIDPATNKDVRTLTEKNGHAVNYRDESDRVVTIYPGTTPHIVAKLNEGMLKLYDEGLLGVKEVESFAEILAIREQAGQRTQRRGLAKAAPAAFREEAPAPAGRRVARAVEMGTDGDRQRARADQTEEQGAVNPDGPVNFVVQAPSASTRRKAEKAGKGAR